MKIDIIKDRLEEKFKNYCNDNNIDYHLFDKKCRCLNDIHNTFILYILDNKEKAKLMIGGEDLKPLFKITENEVIDLR